MARRPPSDRASRGGAAKPANRQRPPPRIRRTAEEAHRKILDATERRLIEGGPEAVRLQEIAADVGISHPTILHHFGNREGLLAALVDRAIAGLETELLEILSTRESGERPAARAERTSEMFERVHSLFAERGYARLFAGLILSRPAMRGRKGGSFRTLVRAMHENRVKRRIEDGRAPPSWDETAFGLTLVWVALFGDALFGATVRTTIGLREDASTGRRFRRWLARLLEAAP